MVQHTIKKYGKTFYLDSIKPYSQFKKRLTLLRKIHPNMKYTYVMIGTGGQTRFALYVRRWGI